MSSDKPGRTTGITRREALRDLGAAAGAAAATPLLGCGDDATGSGGGTSPGPQPVGITHMVVVMMENRTYDHYFGAEPPVTISRARRNAGTGRGAPTPAPLATGNVSGVTVTAPPV